MDILGTLQKLSMESGFAAFFVTDGGWKNLIMIIIAFVLLYLGIVKKFEPLLLCGIAFGCLLTNLSYFIGMGENALYHPELWEAFLDEASPYYHSYGHVMSNAGLLDFFYIGVKAGIYPSLIFLGVGAMTDFGPLLANPKSLLLGASAQLGVFVAFLGAIALGFTGPEGASIGIIGGADGPTAIFLTSKLAPDLLGAISISAYSYMALVPVIQPPVMRLFTTKKERLIHMKPPRQVSTTEKILFPIIGLLLTTFVVPSAIPLLGTLFFGNLLKECGVTKRLANTASGSMTDIVTILLGFTVGASTQATTFLTPKSLYIFIMGACAFFVASSCGVLFVKFFNLFLPKDAKINPLIGNAGVSAVPAAARVSQEMGLKYDKTNYLLMHAMGPNVAGVIGSAVAAGVLLAFLA